MELAFIAWCMMKMLKMLNDLWLCSTWWLNTIMCVYIECVFLGLDFSFFFISFVRFARSLKHCLLSGVVSLTENVLKMYGDEGKKCVLLTSVCWGVGAISHSNWIHFRCFISFHLKLFFFFVVSLFFSLSVIGGGTLLRIVFVDCVTAILAITTPFKLNLPQPIWWKAFSLLTHQNQCGISICK